MELTRQDLKDFLTKNNFHNQKEVKVTRKMASNWELKDLCCWVALQTMEFGRSIDKSIENAVNCIILCLFPPCNPHSKGIAFHLSIYPARRAAHRHRRTNAAPLAAVNSSR